MKYSEIAPQNNVAAANMKQRQLAAKVAQTYPVQSDQQRQQKLQGALAAEIAQTADNQAEVTNFDREMAFMKYGQMQSAANKAQEKLTGRKPIRK